MGQPHNSDTDNPHSTKLANLADVVDVDGVLRDGDIAVYNKPRKRFEIVAEVGGAVFKRRSSDPVSPPTARWKLYAKSDGLYAISDVGTVYGPLTDAILDGDFTASGLMERTASGVYATVLNPYEHPAQRSNGHYLQARSANLLGSYTLVADRLLAWPQFISRKSPLNQLRVYCSTAQAGKGLRLGIYECSSLGVIGSRFWGPSDAISLAATGDLYLDITSGPEMTPGWWWIAAQSDASTATLRPISTVEAVKVHGTNTPWGAPLIYAYNDSGDYGADPIPATFGTLSWSGGSSPAAYVRVD